MKYKMYRNMQSGQFISLAVNNLIKENKSAVTWEEINKIYRVVEHEIYVQNRTIMTGSLNEIKEMVKNSKEMSVHNGCVRIESNTNSKVFMHSYLASIPKDIYTTSRKAIKTVLESTE